MIYDAKRSQNGYNVIQIFMIFNVDHIIRYSKYFYAIILMLWSATIEYVSSSKFQIDQSKNFRTYRLSYYTVISDLCSFGWDKLERINFTTITDSSMAEYQTHDQKGYGSNLPWAKLFLFKTSIVISYMGVFISLDLKMCIGMTETDETIDISFLNQE